MALVNRDVRASMGTANMTIRTIAYFTDAHLGQKVHSDGETASNKMSYLDEPAEHRDNLQLVLNDIAEAGIREVHFRGRCRDKGFK